MDMGTKPSSMQVRHNRCACVARVHLPPRTSQKAPQHQHRQHAMVTRAAPSSTANAKKNLAADVVVIGAGIIGLLTAQALLKEHLSVVLVERQQLCAGATGAGQGYIWMSHRSPSAPSWELAAASTRMWRDLIQVDAGFGPGIEWQDTGSLLLARSAEEVAMLREHASMLQQHGVPASLLSASEVMKVEPAARVPDTGAGLLAPRDAQINGRLTAALLLKRCQAFGPAFQGLMQDPVEHLDVEGCSDISDTGHVVLTQHHRIQARLATVVAAGVWTGQLLAQATKQMAWKDVFRPRRGHLLELERPASMPIIKSGMMEVSYTKHYASSPGAAAHSSGTDVVDITFTATTSAAGTLLIGSSRELHKMDKAADPKVVAAVMQRAVEYLPGLEGCAHPTDDAVRVGPRPYAAGGLPFIGPVPGHPGLFCAAGHEGSGLCQGPATADLICQYVRQGVAAEPHQSAVKGILSIDDAWCRALLPEKRLAAASVTH